MYSNLEIASFLVMFLLAGGFIGWVLTWAWYKRREKYMIELMDTMNNEWQDLMEEQVENVIIAWQTNVAEIRKEYFQGITGEKAN
jgi:hypothetical protein